MKALAPGTRFGRLTVVRQLTVGRLATTLCRCDCGTVRSMRMSVLTQGGTKSCGCYRREHSRRMLTRHGETSRTQGKQISTEWLTWRAIHARCRNSRRADFQRYGGRGIYVCERWQSFDAFLQDMGRKPSKGHSLDRVDPDGPYEPSNCRWATALQQRHNRSTKLRARRDEHGAIEVREVA